MQCERCQKECPEDQLNKVRTFNLFQLPVIRSYCPDCLKSHNKFQLIVTIVIVVVAALVASTFFL